MLRIMCVIHECGVHFKAFSGLHSMGKCGENTTFLCLFGVGRSVGRNDPVFQRNGQVFLGSLYSISFDKNTGIETYCKNAGLGRLYRS